MWGRISSILPQMLKPVRAAMNRKLSSQPLAMPTSSKPCLATFLQAAECLFHILSNVSAIDPHRTPPVAPCKISVTFVDKDGDENLVKVPIGMSMLEAAHENDIELEDHALIAK